MSPRALAVALALHPVAAWAADDMTVEAYRRGAAVEVVASATLTASHELVWRTLTDFDGLASFIPGILRSRVVERRGPESVVEQVGEARFLFFRFPIDVTLATLERAPDVIEVRLIKGNLRRLEGAYRIERGARPGTLVLHWRGLIQPESALPPLFGEIIMRRRIEDQFAGMVREIERRRDARSVAAPAR